MNRSEKQDLVNKLAASHATTQKIIEGIDLETRIYIDTAWRIRDILGHIATWDREAIKSLQAFLEDSEYFIPDLGDESDFNEQAVTEQRTLSNQELIADWNQAREEFKKVIDDIPADQFPGDVLYPWGDERGPIALLVDYMVEHDEEHRSEILKAI
jgi:hypothetical protein